MKRQERNKKNEVRLVNYPRRREQAHLFFCKKQNKMKAHKHALIEIPPFTSFLFLKMPHSANKELI